MEERSSSGLVAFAVIVGIVAVVFLLLLPSAVKLSADMTARQQATAQIAQARAAEQVTLQQERTERARLDSQERQHNADLRAEQWAAAAPMVAAIAGLLILAVVALCAAVVLDKLQARQAARQLTLIEAARQLEAQRQTLSIQAQRRGVEVWTR